MSNCPSADKADRTVGRKASSPAEKSLARKKGRRAADEKGARKETEIDRIIGVADTTTNAPHTVRSTRKTVMGE